MGDITLTSSDGHRFDVFEALPEGEAKGGIVVLQEIFGVNQHIREVAQGYADKGYAALAPAIFDRVERKIEFGYEDQSEFDKGLDIAFSKLSIGDALVDIQTTVDALAKFGNVGVVGYCFGGLLTWLSACSVSGLSAASCYYGGGISDNLDQENKCPTIMHFGLKDPYIPVEQIEKIKAKLSHLDIYTYDSDHGFNCNHRGSYDENSADLALSRTLTFFADKVGS